MSDHSNTIPDKPEGWQPDRSMHSNMTDYTGKLWSKQDDKGRLWKMFIDRLQPTRDITGHHQGIGSRCADHNETILGNIEKGEV